VEHSFQVFDSEDAPYLAWLAIHPDGLVVNTRRRVDPTYAVLHRASCYLIKEPPRAVKADPLTSHGYVKICGIGMEAVMAGLRAHGLTGISKRCGRCGA